MKTSINWLKQYIDIPWSPRELAERLTMAGLEVEGIDETGAVPEGVVVGEILSRDKHPNADKLSVCQVNVGTAEPVQIVCGAPNCDTGVKAPVALPGAVLAAGFKIKKAKLRGVESAGMLCSARELELGDDQSGIMHLPAEAAPGRPLQEYLQADTVIDWEVTPNRPDWLSHIGIAREIAALTDNRKALRLPAVELTAGGTAKIADLAKVEVKDEELCPRYTARLIQNVKIGPSPVWMQRALESVGIRPINNVVDITNFVLMECGQPLHAFDYEKLAGHMIVVRRAADGEEIMTLDGKKHRLTRDNLLIADAERGVALAGIMGGENSEISEQTTSVLLESAAFNPANIRATARRLGIGTESSHRFERGVDIEMTEFASRRAAQLICELAGGVLVSGSIDAYACPYRAHEVTCRTVRASSLIGVEFTAAEIGGFLGRLGLDVTTDRDGTVRALIPSCRLDLTREADLIEEVARLYGLDNLPAVPAAAKIGGGMAQDAYVPIETARAELLGLGLDECLNYTLLNAKAATRGTGTAEDELVVLSNPISLESAFLRPSLLPGMIDSVARNIAHQNEDLALFEIGRVMTQAQGLPEERYQAVIALTGHPHPERFGKERLVEYDFFDLKGVLESWFTARRLLNVECVPCSHPAFKSGRAARFTAAGKPLAVFGEVSPELTADMRLQYPLFVAMIELDTVFAAPAAPRKFQALPQFPSTARDISLVAPATVSNKELLDTLRSITSPWLERVELFDVFEDEKTLGKGRRSLAYSLTYRDSRRTLKDEEVNEAHEALKAELARRLPVEYR